MVVACLLFFLVESMQSKPGTISGTVLELNGKPIEDVRVYFVTGPLPLPEIAALTDKDGKFTLTAPAEGEYEIGFSADGYKSVTVSTTVTRGQNAQIEVRLSR